MSIVYNYISSILIGFEVIRVIASGRTVREIANLVSLSDETISNYLGRILEKMAMRTNAELTHYGIEGTVHCVR